MIRVIRAIRVQLKPLIRVIRIIRVQSPQMIRVIRVIRIIRVIRVIRVQIKKFDFFVFLDVEKENPCEPFHPCSLLLMSNSWSIHGHSCPKE